MTPTTLDGIAESVRSLHGDVSEIKAAVAEIAGLQRIANGRITSLEIQNAHEDGARQAREALAVVTAQQLTQTTAATESRRQWTVGRGALVFALIGTISTAANFLSHLVIVSAH